MEEQLEARWGLLLQATAPSVQREVSQRWFGVIKSKYSEPHRFYHTLNHINELLSLYDTYNLSSPVICFSIWFHDIIYDPKKGDNEAESAVLFKEFANEISLNSEIVQTVAHFINCTKSHTDVPVGNKELDYFLDFDLSVLAKSPDEYDKYAHQIRQEYIHYPDGDYKKGRARVLDKFIDIPTLYRTDECRLKFQDAAKTNMRRELANLSK